MRYRLRTLLIVLALGPPLIAASWWGYGKWRQWQAEEWLRRHHPPAMPVVDPTA